jgi:hypothetical protein
MGIRPTVVGEEPEGRPAAPEDLVGTWVSEERHTKYGRMSFVFRLEADGPLEVIGTPADRGGEAYRRAGPYRVEGGRLVTPALNEGQPIPVTLHDGRLVLTIDEALSFRLRRQRPARRKRSGPASE